MSTLSSNGSSKNQVSKIWFKNFFVAVKVINF